MMQFDKADKATAAKQRARRRQDAGSEKLSCWSLFDDLVFIACLVFIFHPRVATQNAGL